MRTTQANRLARGAAIIAALLAIGVFAIYLRRSWQAREMEKHEPPPVPSTVQRSSQGFSFSKVEKDLTLFTVRASSATEFKDGGRSVLVDVWITIFGRKGDRSDNIHTHSCDYISNPDRIVCSGQVQMDLESAEDARRAAAAPKGTADDSRVVHVVTTGVTFDRDSGDSTTEQPVEFHFSGGEGRAVGARYHSDDGVLELHHDVRVKLIVQPSHHEATQALPPTSSSSPVDVTGTSLEFRRDARTVVLQGPVVVSEEALPVSGQAPSDGVAAVRVGSRELHASHLTVNLDNQFHARHITADGDRSARPQVIANGPKGAGTLTADKFVADMAVQGWVEHFSALGNAQADFKSATPGETGHVSAGRIDAEMVPKLNQPRLVTVSGGVRVDSTRAGKNQTIETAGLELNLVPGPPRGPRAKPSYHMDRVRSLAPATLTTKQPISGAAGGGQRVTQVSGRQVEVSFDERNRLRHLQATGGTELDRDQPGKARQTSTSQELAAEFDEKGQWTTVDQSGNVQFRQGDRSGKAAKSHVDNSTEVVMLSGSAEAADANTHTTADTISFDRNSNDLHADGHVLSTYRKSSDNAPRGSSAVSPHGMGMSPSLGADPAHITSEHLVGNSVSGRALYSGHARLWQGDSTMEADEIELNRDSREMDARGNVRAVFLQTGSSLVARPSSAAPPRARKGAPAPAAKQSASATPAPAPGPKQPDVMRVRAGALTYLDEKSQAHLDHGCTAESRDGTISGQSCDLFFAPAAADAQAPKAGGSTQRLDHAVVIGNVIVKTGDRRAVGDRGEYDAAAGKFILSGGNPTLYDAAGNSTRGRQLTFFLADDTILVESDAGSRTLTRYRVQK